VILVALIALLAAIRIRLAPVEWAWAWPGPGRGLLAGPWLTATVVAAAGLVVATWRRLPAADRRSFLVVASWPAVPLAMAWLIVPVRGWPGPSSIVLVVLTTAAGGLLWRRRPLAARPRGPAWHAGRGWRAAHLAGAAVLIGIGVALGGFADARVLGLSLLLYPLYATIQLVLVLVVPWPWLQRATGDDSRATIVTSAAVFALVHWPNPVVMGLTGAGMLVWAHEYARGRSLAALAVSMGLLATLVAQGLPDPLTRHMRVGPGDVRVQSVPQLTSTTLAAVRASSIDDHVAAEFLSSLYPQVVGRPVAPAELTRWLAVIEFERRCHLAWEFLSSDEAHRRLENAPPAMDGSVHWTELQRPWPARIRAHAREPAGRNGWSDYVASCYRDLLGRGSTADERAAWTADLGPNQYQRIVRTLIERRHELADAPFDTLTSEALEFWR
jgi:hypothetical protein